MADILSSRNKTKKTGAQNRERNPEKILFRLRARVLPNKHQKGNVVDPRKKTKSRTTSGSYHLSCPGGAFRQYSFCGWTPEGSNL